MDEARTSKRLKWPSQPIKIHLSSSLFSQAGAIKGDGEVRNAVLRALQRWEEAADLEFQIAYSDINDISPRGRAGDGVSIITIAPEPENLSAFTGNAANASGLTRVFYDTRGFITEADIALNPGQLFTTDKTPGTFDLESVVAHEVGHLLGLSHSPDASSVMFDGVPRNGAFESPNHTRPLSSDDRSKIRKVYGNVHAMDGCCASLKARLGVPGDPTGSFLVWVQHAHTGALGESNLLKPNGVYEFGPLAGGSYEVIAQSRGGTQVWGALHSGAKDVRSQPNTTLAGQLKPVSFDIQYLGLNGELSKRAVGVFAGSSYRLVLAGYGLADPELRFGVTSKDITLDSVRSESWTAGNGLVHRAFQLTVSRTVAPGQYSIFAEDHRGIRRYLVGGIAVY